MPAASAVVRPFSAVSSSSLILPPAKNQPGDRREAVIAAETRPIPRTTAADALRNAGAAVGSKLTECQQRISPWLNSS